jgi:hypothetical protein
MSNTTVPATDTDAEILAAIDRGVAAGIFVIFDPNARTCIVCGESEGSGWDTYCIFE